MNLLPTWSEEEELQWNAGDSYGTFIPHPRGAVAHKNILFDSCKQLYAAIRGMGRLHIHKQWYLWNIYVFGDDYIVLP